MQIPPNLDIPTTESFNSALRGCASRAVMIFDGETTSFIPTVVTIEQSGPRHPLNGVTPVIECIHVMPDFDVERGEEEMFALGFRIGHEERLILMAFFTCEAWLKRGVSHRELRRGPKPGEMPDRIEVVLTRGVTPDGKIGSAWTEITRGEGEVMIAGEHKIDPYIERATGRVQTLDDFLGSLMRGWERGLADLAMRAN